MHTIETLCETPFLCGEGPVWIPKTKELYWTDSDGKSIRCYSENTKSWKEISNSIHASSLAPHSDGGFVFGNKSGFYHLDKDNKTRTIANICDGVSITNINDIIADPLGRIFGGQECFNPDNEYNTGYLYRVDLNGEVSIVDEGLHISNGMGFSPDNKLFYLVDTIVRNIYVFDYEVINGTISNKKIFATLDKNDGLPDGLTVDSEGYVWIARFLGGGITRYKPNGAIEKKIRLECAQPTSLTFGGKDFNELYITSASMYWETGLAPNNHNYKMLRGGQLYRIKQEIIGKPEYLVRI